VGTKRQNRRGSAQALVSVDEAIAAGSRRLQRDVERFLLETDTVQAMKILDDVNDSWLLFGEAIELAYRELARRVRAIGDAGDLDAGVT